MTEALERLFWRTMRLIGCGRIKLVNDADTVQKVQVRLGPDEVRDNTLRLAEYGLTSNPPAGSDAVVLFAGGDRSDGVVIATGHRLYRLKNLHEGEVALYDDLGQSIYLTRQGIVINSAGLPITINGNITLNGTMTATNDVIASGKSLKSHVHGGVTPGGATTGGPA